MYVLGESIVNPSGVISFKICARMSHAFHSLEMSLAHMSGSSTCDQVKNAILVLPARSHSGFCQLSRDR